MPRLDDLPVENRIKLVQDLWDSIAADTGAVPVDAHHLDIVRARLSAYEADLERGEPAKDVAERIRRAL